MATAYKALTGSPTLTHTFTGTGQTVNKYTCPAQTYAIVLVALTSSVATTTTGQMWSDGRPNAKVNWAYKSGDIHPFPGDGAVFLEAGESLFLSSNTGVGWPATVTIQIFEYAIGIVT